MIFDDNLSIQSSTKSQQQQEINLLNSISPYFSVKSTDYGGRGCFANCDLIEGTIVHECHLPLSSSIRRPFKKEVCEYCFTYLHGNILKYKLTSNSFSSLSIYFCSQICLENFVNFDVDNLYLESLLNVEHLFIKGLNQRQSNIEKINKEDKQEENLILEFEDELKQNKDIELFICHKWKQAEVDCQSISTKQKFNLIPSINENEYLDIKYIVGILFQMYKHDYYPTNDSLTFQLELFQYLQSNDVAKVCAYPYLLYSYLKIYKFLKLSTIAKLESYINPSMIRLIIGKHLTNAFGIRSIDEPDGNKEFFGYALYPSASFFNHSCQPNLIHLRIGSKKIFKLSKNVKKDQELLISYIPFDNVSFQLRQQEIKEWFFDCFCQRCIQLN